MENKTEDAGQHFQSIFCPGVKVRKIRTDADLNRMTLNWLITEYTEELGETPDILLVSTHGLVDAKEVVPILGYELRIISMPLLKDDAWALAGTKGVFWSPGA